MKNILIADDYPLTLMGTKSFVEALGYRVVETCVNGIIALNSLSNTLPDVAILDVSMPGLTGIEIAEKVIQRKIATKIVLLTMHNEQALYLKAKSLGVVGYLLKEYAHEELNPCLKAVIAGNTFVSQHLIIGQSSVAPDGEGIERLTFAERKIVQLIAQQRSSKEIAELLFISERTVENHRYNIAKKLDLPKDKHALLLWAMQQMPISSSE